MAKETRKAFETSLMPRSDKDKDLLFTQIDLSSVDNYRLQKKDVRPLQRKK